MVASEFFSLMGLGHRRYSTRAAFSTGTAAEEAWPVCYGPCWTETAWGGPGHPADSAEYSNHAAVISPCLGYPPSSGNLNLGYSGSGSIYYVLKLFHTAT